MTGLVLYMSLYASARFIHFLSFQNPHCRERLPYAPSSSLLKGWLWRRSSAGSPAAWPHQDLIPHS